MTNALPQLERLFLTDGGIETDMIFNKGIDLPCMSAIVLLRSMEGRKALEAYYRPYLDLAKRARTGFVLESASWRASPDWAPELGITQQELDELNVAAVSLLARLRDEYAGPDLPIVISGCLGPRGDGYDPGRIMSVEEAQKYHSHQAAVLAEAGADMLAAITMTNVNEAIGIVRAARELDVPVAISFTVETDGTLPTGDALSEAIIAVDAATVSYASYFMINCAHPTHFAPVLEGGGAWVSRVRGVRANASRCSHAELDAMTELDAGDPDELGKLYQALREQLPNLNVLGGCCGTDLRHVTAIAESCAHSSGLKPTQSQASPKELAMHSKA